MLGFCQVQQSLCGSVNLDADGVQRRDSQVTEIILCRSVWSLHKQLHWYRKDAGRPVRYSWATPRYFLSLCLEFLDMYALHTYNSCYYDIIKAINVRNSLLLCWHFLSSTSRFSKMRAAKSEMMCVSLCVAGQGLFDKLLHNSYWFGAVFFCLKRPSPADSLFRTLKPVYISFSHLTNTLMYPRSEFH